MKRGTTKFYAACWRELMRFLIETVADDEKGEYPGAVDFFTLMCQVERKVSDEK
jgi:hypothetical protein